MTESAPDGFVVIDKPAGVTSHDVVAQVRRRLGIRKVGHGGTLDPMATGVLVLAVGRSTRLLRWVSAGDKCYEARMRLGSATSTDDLDGDVVSTASPEAIASVTAERIEEAFQAFRGEFQQRPSSVSAIKVGGVRAHARVRAGEDVDLTPRTVTVSSLEWGEIDRGPYGIDLRVAVCCSSGTYVRAIARDVGAELGVGGHLRSLRRTRVGDFALSDAQAVDHVTIESVVPLRDIVPRILPVWEVDEDQARAIAFGQVVPWICATAGTHAFLSPTGDVIAVGSEERGRIRYECVFA